MGLQNFLTGARETTKFNINSGCTNIPRCRLFVFANWRYQGAFCSGKRSIIRCVEAAAPQNYGGSGRTPI